MQVLPRLSPAGSAGEMRQPDTVPVVVAVCVATVPTVYSLRTSDNTPPLSGHCNEMMGTAQVTVNGQTASLRW